MEEGIVERKFRIITLGIKYDVPRTHPKVRDVISQPDSASTRNPSERTIE
jgi:hypothetical protein